MEALGHVYWIGGGSGAGKPTIARRLAARHGMRCYSTDDAMADHARRSTPEDAPYLAEFIAMDMDERWLDRSPEAMLETFHWFRGEGFGLIIEDLLRFPPEPPVAVEGFRLLPDLVKPLLAAPRQAVWLLPTHPSSAGRRSTVEARRGRSRAGPVTRSGPSATWPSGNGSSPNGWWPRRGGSTCQPSPWTPL